jgi:hypothetical protein
MHHFDAKAGAVPILKKWISKDKPKFILYG